MKKPIRYPISEKNMSSAGARTHEMRHYLKKSVMIKVAFVIGIILALFYALDTFYFYFLKELNTLWSTLTTYPN